MIITYEIIGDLSLIYINFKEKAGTWVSMVHDVKCAILLDQSNKWVGLEIYKINGAGDAVDLPTLNYNARILNESVTIDEKLIKIIFDSRIEISDKFESECNIDIGSEGLYGFEIMVKNFSFGLDIARIFIKTRIECC